MENVIQYLEDEIDSLKSAYKSSMDKDSKTIYSTKILEFQKAVKILKNEKAK